ncbi:UNVERIFIED_CONTAM: hypothetical protein NCL1_61461 [Trichonephila clavipes]
MQNFRCREYLCLQISYSL